MSASPFEVFQNLLKSQNLPPEEEYEILKELLSMHEKTRGCSQIPDPRSQIPDPRSQIPDPRSQILPSGLAARRKKKTGWPETQSSQPATVFIMDILTVNITARQDFQRIESDRSPYFYRWNLFTSDKSINCVWLDLQKIRNV